MQTYPARKKGIRGKKGCTTAAHTTKQYTACSYVKRNFVQCTNGGGPPVFPASHPRNVKIYQAENSDFLAGMLCFTLLQLYKKIDFLPRL